SSVRGTAFPAALRCYSKPAASCGANSLLAVGGVEGVGAVDGGFGQDVAVHGAEDVGGGEAGLERQAVGAEGEQAEEVAVGAQVVRGRVGAVVAVVVALHAAGVAGEPSGVVVEALAAAVGAVRR